MSFIGQQQSTSINEYAIYLHASHVAVQIRSVEQMTPDDSSRQVQLNDFK